MKSNWSVKMEEGKRRIVAVERKGRWYIEIHAENSRWPCLPFYGRSFRNYTQAYEAIVKLEGGDVDEAANPDPS